VPTYQWQDGEHKWDVIASVVARNEPQACPACGKPGERMLSAPNISNTAGDWNRPEYNPGLGCVTYGGRDRERKAKERGLIEVGNETPATLDKLANQAREDRREKRYNEALKDIANGDY